MKRIYISNEEEFYSLFHDESSKRCIEKGDILVVLNDLNFTRDVILDTEVKIQLKGSKLIGMNHVKLEAAIRIEAYD